MLDVATGTLNFWDEAGAHRLRLGALESLHAACACASHLRSVASSNIVYIQLSTGPFILDISPRQL